MTHNADGRNRPLIRWECDHDNGWTTTIAEQADGSFAASASNGQTGGVDYTDPNISYAHAAVMASLRRKSGHGRCSPDCSDWRAVVLGVMPAAPPG